MYLLIIPLYSSMHTLPLPSQVSLGSLVCSYPTPVTLQPNYTRIYLERLTFFFFS